ncbi:MAG: 3-dehydroquinate synthase [Anaerolineales bacterium]|nr:3-dehydroquinate synthase [Anaerolineales bacterium]
MKNIILTGFMGTGKTTIGLELARQLRRLFLDMDTEIEARAGKSIERIFSEDGEAVFRGMETRLCQELSTQQGLVIATGGGTLVAPDNRALLLQNGIGICLDAHPDEIARRLQGTRHRPLLNVEDPKAEIERLLAARREAYAALLWHIDTTGLSTRAVVQRAMEIAAVITLPVRSPDGTYEIHVGNGLLAHVGDAIRACGGGLGSPVALVANPTVAQEYAGQVEASVRAAGLSPALCSIADGEAYKTLDTVAGLYEQFLAGGLDRSGTVVALGGGVTGDVAGFAAATYMRGLRLVQVPTTLLSMVDSSVGGKTGVDLPQGKNLVGAFKQPAVVLIDPSVLATLPPEELRSGLAEVIKHGIIGAPELFAELQLGHGDLTSWWGDQGATHVAWALEVKIEIVEDDPFEQGRRAVLNLGHTTGHALERLSEYTLRHGEAVAIGMVAATQIAARMGRANPTLVDTVRDTLSAWGLPVRCPPYDVGAIWQAMEHDKKRRGKALRWVLPVAISRVEVTEDVPREVVTSVLQEMGASAGSTSPDRRTARKPGAEQAVEKESIDRDDV